MFLPLHWRQATRVARSWHDYPSFSPFMSPPSAFIRLLLAAYPISYNVYFNSSLSPPPPPPRRFLFLPLFPSVYSSLHPFVARSISKLKCQRLFLFTFSGNKRSSNWTRRQLLCVFSDNSGHHQKKHHACVALISMILESKKKNIFQEISFLCFVSNIHILGSTTSIKAAYMYLRTFAPKNFPRTDFFKTLTASRKW